MKPCPSCGTPMRWTSEGRGQRCWAVCPNSGNMVRRRKPRGHYFCPGCREVKT